MRKVISILAALAFALVFATIASAQGNGRLNGEIKDKDGNPWVDLTVEIKNPDTGQTLTLKTDKSGKFVQLGLRGGIYTITLLSPKDNISYPTKFQLFDDKENDFKVNFKDVLAEAAAAHPDAAKAKEDEENKYKMMKTHFDAGVAAINDSNDLAKQIKTAPADQKSQLQQKKAADCEKALTEFGQAEQGVGPKEVNNHALVWGNLGQAQECAGHFEDAAKAFQNAVDLKPQANYYAGLATNTAKAAVAQNDPKVTEAKLADASAACEKATATDPVEGERCWKNVGFVLTNKDPKYAVVPLRKATEADPKDLDAWFYLGGALFATSDMKQVGDKMVCVPPQGTAEAYQKYLSMAPTGPHAAESQAMLQGISECREGSETKVKAKKKG